MFLRRWGFPNSILRLIIKANVVVIATFLSTVSFWSVKITPELLWLPVSSMPICFLPVAVFYAFEKNRFSDPREQGSYMISMMLGNIGTLAGLCAYVLFGAIGFAYIQLIAIPQILTIVLFCFPMGQYYHDRWAHQGQSGPMKIHLREMLLTWNQLPAVGVLVGLTLAALHVEKPEIVSTTFTILIHLSAWMGMVPVGYDLDLKSARAYAWKLWPVFPIKFIFLPVVLYGLTTLFVSDPAIITCVILAAAAPTAIFAVASAQLYKLNVDLAESSFLTTTLAFLFLIYPLVYWIVIRSF
jgi:predicted permease